MTTSLSAGGKVKHTSICGPNTDVICKLNSIVYVHHCHVFHVSYMYNLYTECSVHK